MADSNSGRWLKWFFTGVLGLLVLGGAALFIYTSLQPRFKYYYRQGNLHLRSGQISQAVTSFRKALDAKPGSEAAQSGLIKAFRAGNQFDEALSELDALKEMGAEADEVAMRRADILMDRVQYRLDTGPDTPDPDFFDPILQEGVTTAIEALTARADEAEEPGRLHTRLGELYMRKSRILARKWQRQLEARRRARNLNETERVESLSEAISGTTERMSTAQQNGVEAYERAIEADPAMKEPRIALAEHYISTYVPRLSRVRNLLTPIIEDTPEHQEARKLLAEADLMARRYDSALEHLEALPTPEGEEQEFEVLSLKTEVLVQKGDWDKAAPLSARLIERRPQHRMANYLRGRVLIQQEKYEDAAGRLQGIFAGDQVRWPRGRFALAHALREAGNTEQAITQFNKTLTGVSEFRVTNIRTGQRLEQIRYAANLALAEELKNDSPQVAAEHANQAFEVYPHQKRAFQLARELRQATGADEQTVRNLYLQHARSLAERGNFERAISVCSEAISEHKAGLEARSLKAQLLARNGAYSQAVELFEELRSQADETSYDYQLARLHRNLGDSEKAAQIYREILNRNPQDQRARQALVELLLRGGETEEALSLLREASGEDFGSIQQILVAIHLRQGRTEKALDMARRFAESDPESAPAQVLLGRLLWMSNELQDAQSHFTRAVELAPGTVEPYLGSLVHLQQGQPDKAVELLSQARQRIDDSPLPLVYLGLARQAQGQLDDAVSLWQSAVEQAQNARQQPASICHWYLAVARAQQKQMDEARRHNRQFRRDWFGLVTDRQRFLEKLAGMDGSDRHNVAFTLNLSFALRENGNVPAAARAAEEMHKLMPDSTLLACWQQSLHSAAGRVDQAISGYQKLLEDNPDFLYARVKLSEAHMSQGRLQKAVNVLEQALEHADEREAPLIHMTLASLYEQQQRYDKAIQSYRKAARFKPRAPEALNNIAWLLATEKGQLEEALPLARRSLQLGGPRPQVLDTLGWILCRQGNTEDAINYLKAAKTGLPHLPSVRYHLGVAYMEAGQPEQARQELTEALNISQNFPAAADARQRLSQL